MNVIKRSGEEVVFDASKIENAIKKANKATTHNQMTDELIHSVTQSVIDKCENLKRSPNVEEIQDMVEGELMEHRCFAVAHNYITYRYERAPSGIRRGAASALCRLLRQHAGRSDGISQLNKCRPKGRHLHITGLRLIFRAGGRDGISAPFRRSDGGCCCGA